MKEKTFLDFWEHGVQTWYENAVVEAKPVRELCSVQSGVGSVLYRRYLAARDLVKDAYFKDPSKRLSKYKRAAVIAQVILLTDPLVDCKLDENGLDPYFLKQRLAFFMAMESILTAYPKQTLEAAGKPLFHFDELDAGTSEEEDSFLMSVYKDMFFSELYENYNVLTMANVFGLITERLSELGKK